MDGSLELTVIGSSDSAEHYFGIFLSLPMSLYFLR